MHLTTTNTPHTSKHTKTLHLYTSNQTHTPAVTINQAQNAYTLPRSLHTLAENINRLIQTTTISINTSEASVTKA